MTNLVKPFFLGLVLSISIAGTAFAQNNNNQQTKAAGDKVLMDYFVKNNISASQTPSGLCYVITQKGTGDLPKPGQRVTMSYTGKLMDGKVFDSNTDPQFHHVAPFTFTLGVGQVIKGWDEGVQLLPLGSKGTLYIPPALGYGDRGAGGVIPPNAYLVFDVEVINIEK